MPLPGALRGWSAALPGPTLLRPGVAVDELAAGDVLAGSVVPIVPGRQLLVPFGLLALQVTSETPAMGPGGTVAGRGQPDQYGFVARPEAGLDDSPGEECLALPEKLDPRFRPWPTSWPRAPPAPAERVRRTLRHLDERCRYSLKPGLGQADPLAEFLFEKRQGLCAHFASAAAVLLRLQGVPTRYVRASRWATSSVPGTTSCCASRTATPGSTHAYPRAGASSTPPRPTTTRRPRPPTGRAGWRGPGRPWRHGRRA